MKKNSSQKSDKNANSKPKYWESLSPEERRKSIIETRDALLKNAQKSIIFLTMIGLLFATITINLWHIAYKMNLMSSSAVCGGVILAGAGLYYINSNRIKSSRRIQSDNFTDDDAIAYFREREKVNQNALEQWNQKGKYFIFIGALLILLLFLRSTAQFSFLLLSSGISVFLIGLSILFIVQKILNNVEINKQNGG